MTTPPRVQRHRQTDAARRKVTTRGRRVRRPRAKPAARKPQRAKYQNAGVLGSFSGMCTALFAATGSIFWAVGAVGAGAGGTAAAWFEYRRDLIEVKRTGKPIGAKPTPPASHSTDGLSTIREPKPVDLDEIRKAPVTVHHRAGCPICARTDEHTHARADWEAISDTWEYRNPRSVQPATRARKPPDSKHGPPGHEAKCTAKTKEACPYWRKANPARTRKTTTRKRTK